MINEERILNEFIELVSVPCPSKDEKQEAEMIMAKLREMGLEPEMDNAHLKTGGTCGNVWAYVKGNVPDAPVLFFEAHMDSVAPTTGTKVVRKDGVLYSDGTTTLGGDDKVGIAAMLEAVRALKEDGVAHGDIQLCFTVSEEIGCLGSGVRLALLVELCCYFLISRCGVSLLYLDALVLAQGYFRLYCYFCGENEGLALLQLYDVYGRAGYDLKLALVCRLRICLLNQRVCRVIIEYFRSVHLLDHLTRNLALTEARNGNLLSILQISVLKRCLYFLCGNFNGQLRHVFF